MIGRESELSDLYVGSMDDLTLGVVQGGGDGGGRVVATPL